MPTPFPTARNPVLSLFQPAAAAVARHSLVAFVDAAEHPLPLAAAQIVAARQDPARAYSPSAGIPAPSMTCAALGLELLEAVIAGDADRQRALRNRLSFSRCDPLWAETLVDYARTLRPDGQPRPIPYIRYSALSDFALTAPRADMRIALISDWGTGTDEARQVAALLARHQPDAVIHLGDIYFAGTAEECDTHFLTPPRRAAGAEAVHPMRQP